MLGKDVRHKLVYRASLNMMFVYPINLLTILRSPVNLTHCIIVGQNAQNAYLFIVNVILFEQIIDVLID